MFPYVYGIRFSNRLFFVFIGNVFGKLRKNFFMGIRTPWTLADDEVWLRTHRVGGKLFVLAGVGMFLGTLAGHEIAAGLAGLAVTSIGSVAYSFVEYRRLHPRMA